MSFIRIGQIVGVWGLKGHVKVEPLTDFADDRFQRGARLRLDEDWTVIQEVRWMKDRPYLKLEGVDTPERARDLQWHYLEAKDEPPVLEEDEYLTTDLIGLRVETSSGEVLGKVDDVLPLPAHDVLVVGEVMIPAVKEFVLDVDIEGGMILVQLLEGMRE
jgi:16S rRNA processing protein RimM